MHREIRADDFATSFPISIAMETAADVNESSENFQEIDFNVEDMWDDSVRVLD
jgi:hypothetical protein